MNKAFHQGILIIESLEKNGHEAYFVGGSVRDTLMNRAIGDIDIATSATPEEIQAIFPKTIDVGAEHGTIIVVTSEQESYEVTTFRTDGIYTDNRHPDNVTFVKSLEEDLKRRDFTMNAIAMTKYGEIVDPFDGESDIKRRVIRTVGKATERFKEDALRMLRAVRFSSQLSFSVERDTFDGIQKDQALLEMVSVERKTAELEKLLMGQGVKEALELLVTTGLFAYLPHLGEKSKPLRELAKLPLHEFHSRSAIWTLLVIVLKVEDVEYFLNSWKLPKKVTKAVNENIKVIEQVQRTGWVKEVIYRTGLDQSLEAHQVMNALGWDLQGMSVQIRKMYNSLPIHSLKDIVIDGNELINIAGEKRGKWISLLYQDLEMALIHEETENERAALKEWVCNWLQKYDQNY
ncbi:CCA tRNA nucleotidyltransferase [Sutcliffiella horikoshii]|uniref:CCA tRNA nucleotidyltransferase n=1 Tax=Sutcliffiella horikoshii TaxID=79883 RepID=UPI00203FB484|nr:CCA tRNA nucleotidyltransferase [Sutcliffiella horikoshii]MCM3617342.1 CCA tRNA nucleotidyltransferase [Sutcliffiella horikoshii]